MNINHGNALTGAQLGVLSALMEGPLASHLSTRTKTVLSRAKVVAATMGVAALTAMSAGAAHAGVDMQTLDAQTQYAAASGMVLKQVGAVNTTVNTRIQGAHINTVQPVSSTVGFKVVTTDQYTSLLNNAMMKLKASDAAAKGAEGAFAEQARIRHDGNCRQVRELLVNGARGGAKNLQPYVYAAQDHGCHFDRATTQITLGSS